MDPVHDIIDMVGEVIMVIMMIVFIRLMIVYEIMDRRRGGLARLMSDSPSESDQEPSASTSQDST